MDRQVMKRQLNLDLNVRTSDGSATAAAVLKPVAKHRCRKQAIPIFSRYNAITCPVINIAFQKGKRKFENREVLKWRQQYFWLR